MIPRVTSDLGTISTLDDRPNDTGGLTAAELKAKFDEDSGKLKTYLNDVLLPFLEGTAAAASLGIETIPGFSADNIQTALEEIVTAMQEITLGSVADRSITLAKLAADVTAAALGGAAASHTHGAGDVSSGVLDEARIPALTGDKLPAGVITAEKLGAAAVTGEKIAALAVLATHLAQGAVTTQKLADKAVTAGKIADSAITATQIAALTITAALIANKTITAAKIADATITATQIANATITGAKMVNKTVTAAQLADNISYTKFGLTSDQVRKITAGTAAPSGGSNGDIYIRYS